MAVNENTGGYLISGNKNGHENTKEKATKARKHETH